MGLFTEQERSELVEVFEMCFLYGKDSDLFWDSVNMQPSFEQALAKAKDLLLIEGMKVFTRPKRRISNKHA